MCEFIGVETNRCQRLDCPITKLVMDAETELAKAKADFAGAMGSLIVAEAVAKDEVEKRKQAQRELEIMSGTVAKLGESLETANGFEQRLQATERQLRAAQDKLADVQAWLREARAGWSGSDNEFTEAYGELAELLGVEFTEDVEVEITLSQTIKVRKTIGVDLEAQDFYTRSYVHVYSNDEDNVMVLDHINDASIDEVN